MDYPGEDWAVAAAADLRRAEERFDRAVKAGEAAVQWWRWRKGLHPEQPQYEELRGALRDLDETRARIQARADQEFREQFAGVDLRLWAL